MLPHSDCLEQYKTVKVNHYRTYDYTMASLQNRGTSFVLNGIQCGPKHMKFSMETPLDSM